MITIELKTPTAIMEYFRQQRSILYESYDETRNETIQDHFNHHGQTKDSNSKLQNELIRLTRAYLADLQKLNSKELASLQSLKEVLLSPEENSDDQ